MRNFLLGILIFYGCLIFVVALPYIFTLFSAVALVCFFVYSAVKLIQALDRPPKPRVEVRIIAPKGKFPVAPDMSGSDIYAQIYRAISQILNLKKTEEDPELKKELLSSRESVRILRDEDYEKHQVLLKSFLETYLNYLDLYRMPKVTEQVRQLRTRTRNNLMQISIALAKMVENQMAPELEKVDIQNEVLDDQLKTSGLMPSDFEQRLR